MSAKEKKFHVFGQTLAGLSWDGQGEPVLALHGWLDNAASYLPLASQWQRPMVALDFSGHGHSDHRPDGVVTHLVDHVRDVLAVADQLGWQRFSLVGHSMGAGIACLFAAAFPERVSRLVLIEGLGPPSTPGEEVANTLRKALDDMMALADKRKPGLWWPQPGGVRTVERTGSDAGDRWLDLAGGQPPAADLLVATHRRTGGRICPRHSGASLPDSRRAGHGRQRHV